MKNNYIYAALGLLALFMIVKNQRSEVAEERQGEDAGTKPQDGANVNPNTLPSVKKDDVLLDFQETPNTSF
jgi:hypothetical protein